MMESFFPSSSTFSWAKSASEMPWITTIDAPKACRLMLAEYLRILPDSSIEIILFCIEGMEMLSFSDSSR